MANLLAPIVLCRRTHLARQVILQDPDLEIRARVFDSLQRGASGTPDEQVAATA